jgi:phosphohistidine phosphatase
MPTLVLMRHAEAEPTPAGGTDPGRPLTPGGRVQCAPVRDWLQDLGIVPGRVVVSSALRAQQTWAHAGVGTAAPEVDDRVYSADVDALRAIVEETPDEVATLVLVGHNPTFERLAWELDDRDVARDRTNAGMRPSAVLVFTLRTWQDASGLLTAWR